MPPKIQVDVVERIKSILGDYKDVDWENGEVSYSFGPNGYEQLTVKNNENEGTYNFSGVFHPNVVCEGGGICMWCGSVF